MLGLFASLGGCQMTAPEQDKNRFSGVVDLTKPVAGKTARRSEAGFCDNRSSPNCRFINGPVKLGKQSVRLPRRALTFFPTAEPLEFVDARGRNWQAPVNTLTDGASIPRLFIRMLGDPKSREFSNAAAMHDAYCGIGNEKGPKFHSRPWREVHRMFYEGLRVGGTDKTRAKIMFAAVYIGGPRWPGAGDVIVSTKGRAKNKAVALLDRPADEIWSDAALRQTLARTIQLILTTDATIPQIEQFADRQMLTTRRTRNDLGGAGPGHGYGYGNGYGDYGDTTSPGCNCDPSTPGAI